MELDYLNAFLGYGDFRNADFLLLSKHEGANNNLLSSEIKVRTDRFGVEEEYWLDKNNRLNGYWHPDVRQVHKFVNQEAGLSPENVRTAFVVLYPARVLLALEEAFEKNSIENIDNWFKRNEQLKGEYADRYKELLENIYTYNQSTNWKAALAHYQPLPRKSGTWPYSEFNKEKYENVFGKAAKPEDPYILKLKKNREEILANLLKNYPKKVIFSTGNINKEDDTDALREFFRREFNASFDSFNHELRTVFGEYEYNGTKTLIVHTHAFANGGGLKLNELCMITKEIYRRLIKEPTTIVK